MIRAFLILLFLLPNLIGETLTGKVIEVTDGDTIKILNDSKKVIRIRLAHIDTPEKGQPYYKEAGEFLAKLVNGKQVKVVWSKEDRNKRLIGVVYLSGQDINLEITKAGLAWHFKRYSDDKSHSMAELEAKKKKAGLFKDSNPTPPWEFRAAKRKASKK